MKLDAGAPLVGKTLLESQLRKRTGASVAAVLRDGVAIANPPIDTRFEAGDTVVIIGTPEQGEAARRELARVGRGRPCGPQHAIPSTRRHQPAAP